MKRNALTFCLMLSAAPALHAAPVSVGARATGGFGNFNTGWQDLVHGLVFTTAGEQAVLIADGQVNGGAGGATITGPDGFPGPVDNNFLLTTNYAPLEEAAVDAGTLVLPRTAGTTVPGFQALFAAFVPDAMAGLPGFRPHDEDLVSAGQTGIPAGALFLMGRGPKLFTAPGAGRLFFGVNDTYAANNSGAYLVSVPEPMGPPQSAPVHVHEILTNNSGALRDEDGDAPDWIELYNPAGTPALLAGWQLRSGGRTWTLPDVTIPPQRYLVVFASGKDRTVLTAPLHTNFALDAGGGESLTLHQPDGTPVSGFAALPAQTADYSYGRNGAGETVWFPVATPGHANGAFVRGFVADTKFSADRGFYDAPVTVAITTDTHGAVIRYTTDGGEPAASSGVIYSAPLTISATTVLRARAFLTEWLPSNTDTHSGHSDEPLSVSFGFERPNNFRALRRHDRETDAWRFFVHDGESSLRAPEWVDNRANAVNLTSANRAQFQFSNPEWMHEDLLASAGYRMAFADTAQRLLLNDGPFTAAKARALWDARAAQIDLAVIGESMRWGQAANHTKATWDAKVAEVRALFFPARSATVIAHLRQRTLFPNVDAPSWSQRGGVVAPGTVITFNSGAQQGTIFYTLDGSDPRAIGGAVSATATAYVPQGIAISGAVAVTVRFRSDTGEWSALDRAAFTLVPAAAPGLLVLSKVHYHPADPTADEISAGFSDDGEFEYLEFLNATAQPLDIRNVRITAGVTFSFAGSAITTLPPGGRVLVVTRPSAGGPGPGGAGNFHVAGARACSSDGGR